jgi:hypothetical protein
MTNTTQATTLSDVITHHNGEITRVETAVGGKIPMTVSFRNVGDKLHFLYALNTAWQGVQYTNHQGAPRVVIVVPMDMRSF